MSVHNFEIRLEERLRKKAFAHYDCHSMTVDFANPIKHRILQERRNTTTGASAASLVGVQKHQLLPKNNDCHINRLDTNSNAHFTNLHNNSNNNNNFNVINNNNHGNDRKLHAIGHNQHNDYCSKTTNRIIHRADNGVSAQETNEQHESLGPVHDLGDGRQNDLVSSCPVFRNELGGEEERIICLNKLTDRRQTNTATELHKPSFVDGISILERATHSSRNMCPYQKSLQCNPIIEYTDLGATYYRNYFYGREHQNWLGASETYGPLAISIRKELSQMSAKCTSNNTHQPSEVKHQYRIIIRTPESAVLRGSVHEDCIPNLSQRTNTRDVLEYLLAKSDIVLNKLRLASPEAETRLLNLDEVKLSKKYKVGILYCKAGQSTEEEFYNNEHSGPLFDEFLSCIGENVRLLGFDKYLGQLDAKNDLDGLYSTYSTYEDCEVMFHVSTMLPYSASDRQQVTRKKHIGNDIVTIVFQEEGAPPFTPKILRSQFQHVFIVVRALNPPKFPDGSYDFSAPRHYAVAVSRSKEIPLFGPPIPEGGIFVKSPQFKNFLLAKVINAENAAQKYGEKFRCMSYRTRSGLLEGVVNDSATNTTLSDLYGSSNSGTSGAVKIVSSLFGGKKRTQRRYAIFCGHSDIQGAIVWDVQVKDFGQSNKIIDCILGISATYLVVIDQQTKELVYVSPAEAILGWTSNPAWIKIFCHQAECLLVQIKDPDVDEICEIVTRLKAVTDGCETRELTLRRKNSQNCLGFDIQPDGIVTRVDAGSIAWQTHLQPGSRLVEICKTSTATLSYSQMMEYIRTSAVVTLTVLPPKSDGTYRRGCLAQTCVHQPIISRPPSTFSSASSSMHFSKPKRRVPTASLMTLV